jgi:crossover junction endodeoxyribonuclease RuvC
LKQVFYFVYNSFMRIIGVDPGLNITGFGVVDVSGDKVKVIDAGSIEPKSKDRFELRIHKVHNLLEKLICEHKPQVLVLEKLYAHDKFPMTVSILGHVRGVICLAAAQQEIELVELSVKRVRKALMGNGNATKPQVQAFVKRLLKLEKTEMLLDTSDALALALGHAHMLRYKLI